MKYTRLPGKTRERGWNWLTACMMAVLLLSAMSTLHARETLPGNHSSAEIQQPRDIMGKVTDSDGNPLPGVNVTVPGTLTGTITGVDGTFTLTVPEGATKLEFSFVGYLRQTVDIGDQTEFNITLLEDVMGLEEVVVVGYGTVKKEDLTGSVSVVEVDEIQQMKVDNVSMALAGRTPGVTVNGNSGNPGKLPTVRIRGIGTINNAEPLYVVDGVPVDPSSIAYLNTNDIESMSVLKDGSALAIYGSRAANGIIEITTKKGKRGDMKVGYSMYYGRQEITQFPDMMTGYEFVGTYNDINGYNPGHKNYIDSSIVSNVNWFELMSQQAPMQNHYLNITGGDKVLYNFSVGAFDQTGIIKNTYLQRYNTRLSTTSRVKKWLNIGQTITLTYSKHKGAPDNWEWSSGGYYEAMMSQRIIEPYDENGVWNLNPYSDAIENPMINIDRNFLENQNYQLNGNAYLELMPVAGLTYKAMAGYNIDFSEADEYVPTYEIDPVNRQLYPELYKQFGKGSTYTIDNLLSYEKQLGDHSFKILAGVSLWQSNYYNLEGRHIRALSNPSERYRFFNEINNGQAPVEVVITDSATVSYEVQQYAFLSGSTPQLDKNVGNLARVEYSFRDKYLFTGNFRRDGSIRFGPANRFGNFWGFAVAWKMHQEAFLQNVDVISQLKLRAGWGQIGNDRIGRYEYLSLMNTNMGYSRSNVFVPGASPSKPPNPFLEWETSETTNFGIDLGLFNGKLQFIGDVYNKITKGMLFNPPAISISGVISPAASNISDMYNRGVELSLNYRHMEGEFRYEVGGHISLNRMKVTRLSEEIDYVEAGTYANRRISDFSRTMVGYPIGMFYGYVTDGIFQDSAEIATSPFHNKNTVPGDRKYKDLNGDNIIDINDKTFIGNPHPDFTYGFNINLMYKGFDLSALFSGMYGHDIFVAYKAHTHDFRNPGFNFHSDLLDYWVEGENTDTDIYAYNRRTNDLNMEESDFYIEDGSFLRLQTLQLGYNLPESVLNAIRFDRFRVYVSVQNLFTLTSYEYGDPDIGTLSVFQTGTQRSGFVNSLIFSTDQVRLPNPRIVSFGIDVSF